MSELELGRTGEGNGRMEGWNIGIMRKGAGEKLFGDTLSLEWPPSCLICGIWKRKHQERPG